MRLLSLLQEGQVPAGRVKTIDQVYRSEQTLSQGLLTEVQHTTLGRLRLPGPPLRFFDASNDAELTRRDHAAPPVLDEHAAAVLEWLNAAETESATTS